MLSSEEKVMAQDKETKRLLIESAKAEFIEKGFEKASLRTICKNAGVTTGALYFFFNNKEDLFSAIVEKPYRTLINALLEHYKEHDVIFGSASVTTEIGDAFVPGNHDDALYILVHLLYQNYDAFRLLLEKSQGTRYENCVDEVVELTERSFLSMAKRIVDLKPELKVNEYMCHWLTHISIDAFIHMLTHVPDEATALKYVKKTMDFILNGWIELVLIEDN